ncbi:hypothetical protein HUJ05_012878 [Dendroctonus ponderosae]|nr:hypothetical protein HUJ05_012878 [Dendroctonus ponderosae]
MASSNPMKISLCVSLNIFVFVSSPRLNYRNSACLMFETRQWHFVPNIWHLISFRTIGRVYLGPILFIDVVTVEGCFGSAAIQPCGFLDIIPVYPDPWCTLFADAPVCIQEREEVYGALKQETVTLRCRVDANPPVAAFHWTFNNSGDQTDVSSEKYTNEVTSSRLNYTPNNDLDYAPFPWDVTSSETVAHCWKLDIHFKETDLEYTANIST